MTSISKSEEVPATVADDIPAGAEEEVVATTTARNDIESPPNDNDTDETAHAEISTKPEKTTESDEQQQKEEEPPSSCCKKACQCLIQFYQGNEFLILVVCAILLARAYPPLGAEYLYPEITATWIAVCFIFFMAGLGLKTSEFTSAVFQRLGFNLFVQVYNLGLVSALVWAVSRALSAANILSVDLANGMVVAASLPMTINMVCVLTKASGGHEGLAIVNAAAGNLMGVFISPILIVGYLGKGGSGGEESSGSNTGVDVLDVFYKLALRVLLPVFVGQLVQKCCPKVVAFHKAHKPWFKKAQEYTLVFIVYTVFCRTFSSDERSSSIGDIFLMILFVFLILTAIMVLAWYTLNLIWKNEPTLCVMGLFGCTHKTVAMGIPLINAIFEKDPAIGLYTLPLLIWHPMQLVIGTFLAPRLSAYVVRRQEEIKAAAADAEAEPTGATTLEVSDRQHEGDNNDEETPNSRIRQPDDEGRNGDEDGK